jgi:hypothetical protein
MFPDTARYTIYVARLLPAVIQVFVDYKLPLLAEYLTIRRTLRYTGSSYKLLLPVMLI